MTALFLPSTHLYGQTTKAESDKKKQYRDVIVNDDLKKIMEVKGVREIFDGCKTQHTINFENIPNCMWEKVKEDSELKSAVMQVYENEKKAQQKNNGPDGKTEISRSSNNNKNDEKNSRTPANFDPKVAESLGNDPAVVALSEFYKKKLYEILDPSGALSEDEKRRGLVLGVDHRKYIDLYKSELSRTIINAFTSYCLDTNANGVMDDDVNEQKKQRKINIEALANADFKDGSPDSLRWKNCILNVPKKCDEGNVPGKLSMLDGAVKRACLIVDYVKAARQNIIAADEQKKFYDELQKNNRTPVIASNVKMLDENDAKNSSDAILKTTSKDIETIMRKPTEELSTEMAKCSQNGQIVSIEACQKFIKTNKNDAEVALAEFGMRQLAQEEQVAEKLSNDTDAAKNVGEYLKKEGHTDQEIAQMTGNKETLVQIKQQILNRHKLEKASIIKEMADRINAKTSETEGKIDQKSDKDKISEIKEEIEKRGEDLGNLVKFNNVVSSYLDIEMTRGGKKENKRNTASLFAEAENDSALKAKAQEAGLEKIESSPDLEVGTINSSLLKYDLPNNATSEAKKSP